LKVYGQERANEIASASGRLRKRDGSRLLSDVFRKRIRLAEGFRFHVSGLTLPARNALAGRQVSGSFREQVAE